MNDLPSFLTMRTVFTKAAELIIKTPTAAVELNAGWMMYHMLCTWQRALFTGYMTLELQPHQINYLISIISKDLLTWAARRCNLAPSPAAFRFESPWRSGASVCGVSPCPLLKPSTMPTILASIFCCSAAPSAPLAQTLLH